MQEVPCDHCGAQRALVCCAHDAARLCLPCDVAVHAAAPAHQRAPLCDDCHAGCAVARCDDHGGAALCAACARGASSHSLRAAATYTGFPNLPDLARILCVGDYIHLITELSSDNTTIQDAMTLDNASDKTMGPTEAFATNDGVNSVDTMEGAFKDPSSLDLDDSSWSELAMPSDAHLVQPLTKNNTAYDYDELSMMSTDTINDVALDMPTAGSSSVIEEEAPPPMNSEEKREQQEKRRLAKQRYNEKKKNRRYIIITLKQIDVLT